MWQLQGLFLTNGFSIFSQKHLVLTSNEKKQLIETKITDWMKKHTQTLRIEGALFAISTQSLIHVCKKATTLLCHGNPSRESIWNISLIIKRNYNFYAVEYMCQNWQTFTIEHCCSFFCYVYYFFLYYFELGCCSYKLQYSYFILFTQGRIP